MRRTTLLFFIAFCCYNLNAQTSADQAVRDAEGRRFEAMTKMDTLALKGMLAEDMAYIHSNAMTENKRQHLDAIGSGRVRYEKMIPEAPAQVRRYGKIAITNGTLRVQGKNNGATFEITLLYTAVYRKQKGRWLLLNWQSTRKN